MKYLFLSAFFFVGTAFSVEQLQVAKPPVEELSQMRTITQTVNEFYSCMSFDRGEHLSPEGLQDLFIQNAILTSCNNNQSVRLSVPAFIESLKEKVSKQFFPYVIIREVSNKTDVFGKIAQCFSTYEFRTETQSCFGINSIQLILIDGSWYITSMAWQDETETIKIP